MPPSSILFWAVHVDLLKSFGWDDALDAAATGCGFTRQEMGLIGDELHSLSRSDLLYVEKAMVRALLDKLAWVMYPRQDGLPFAYDLFSHRELQEPEDDSLRILDPERCMQDKTVEPPSEDDPSEFFCVYTGIQRRETEQGVLQWVPSNVTYVSARAVREALEEAEDRHPSQDIFSVARMLGYVG
ncbi:hypothetical protein N0V82_005942 [Gnomoniopsis sp. IMI 355080]|nr:hypothetical protein N0V82_005942 [Gnomoniopsis sp. IMI 355080]